MEIREARPGDWPEIWPFFRETVRAGETYAYDPELTSDRARALWLAEPPGASVVAVDGGVVLGSATMGPNRPGRGAHIGTASFMVSPAARGRGSDGRWGCTSSTGTGHTASGASSSTPSWRPTRPRLRCGRRSASRSSARSPERSSTRRAATSGCT